MATQAFDMANFMASLRPKPTHLAFNPQSGSKTLYSSPKTLDQLSKSSSPRYCKSEWNLHTSTSQTGALNTEDLKYQIPPGSQAFHNARTYGLWSNYIKGYGDYYQSCMTLGTLYLGNNDTVVYSGHADFSINTSAQEICKGPGMSCWSCQAHVWRSSYPEVATLSPKPVISVYGLGWCFGLRQDPKAHKQSYFMCAGHAPLQFQNIGAVYPRQKEEPVVGTSRP